jgi:hypothetical protein
MSINTIFSIKTNTSVGTTTVVNNLNPNIITNGTGNVNTDTDYTTLPTANLTYVGEVLSKIIKIYVSSGGWKDNSGNIIYKPFSQYGIEGIRPILAIEVLGTYNSNSVITVNNNTGATPFCMNIADRTVNNPIVAFAVNEFLAVKIPPSYKDKFIDKELVLRVTYFNEGAIRN